MSIIGINGKIGSGKDTVGKIIQYLTASNEVRETLTLEEWLESDDLNGRDFNWKIKKFAGKLKQFASLLTGIPVEKFEDQEFKKTYLGPEWGVVRKNPLQAIPVFKDIQFNELMTVREFLQILGTEAMREGLHTNVWVNALFADYTPTHYLIGAFDTKLTDGDPVYPNWIITDMRFPNEMEAVVAKGGITIRVVRPETTVGTHPSETVLDEHIMHYEIINDGTIEDLIERVREILIKENIR
jgi:hypothetical protein